MREINEQQLRDNLTSSLARYMKLKEETSDPIALRFLADIIDDLEREVASLKVGGQDDRTGRS